MTSSVRRALSVSAIVVCALTRPSIASAQSSSAEEVCQELKGAVIVSQDDEAEYLGTIASKFNLKSIFNEFGTHGNEFSAKSIWNEFSKYGNEFNPYSPFNRFSTKPPMIIKNGRVIAYLSDNTDLEGAIRPRILRAVCGEMLQSVGFVRTTIGARSRHVYLPGGPLPSQHYGYCKLWG